MIVPCASSLWMPLNSKLVEETLFFPSVCSLDGNFFWAFPFLIKFRFCLDSCFSAVPASLLLCVCFSALRFFWLFLLSVLRFLLFCFSCFFFLLHSASLLFRFLLFLLLCLFIFPCVFLLFCFFLLVCFSDSFLYCLFAFSFSFVLFSPVCILNETLEKP